jgi:hypothetical protein
VDGFKYLITIAFLQALGCGSLILACQIADTHAGHIAVLPLAVGIGILMTQAIGFFALSCLVPMPRR